MLRKQSEPSAVAARGRGFLLDRCDERLARHEREQRDRHCQPDEGHDAHGGPPGDDRQQHRHRGGKGCLAQIAGKVIDAQRSP